MSWLEKIRNADEPLTDMGNRDRFVARHGADLRYVPGIGWIAWSGVRWDSAAEHVAREWAAETIRSMLHTAIEEDQRSAEREAVIKHALASESRRAIEAMVHLAASHPKVRLDVDHLDSDPWLLNVTNGTLDLRTGRLREHRREDYCTQLAPVAFDPAARAPCWERFLRKVQPDSEIRGFLQRWAGYCLTGNTSEQVFLMNQGAGANGKGVFEATQRAVMGDYASAPPFDTFLARRPGSATNDLADLRAVRLAAASEPEEGGRLAEAIVKRITGEDPITARQHYQPFVTFEPVCKIQLTGNHRLRIRGTDYAIWRRVLLLPWPVTIPKEEQDRDLARRLREELPGILAWIVRGSLEWQREGLNPPAAILAAVEQYRRSEDHVGRFIADCCRLGSNLALTSKAIRSAYTKWCAAEGEDALSAKAFGSKLTDRGIRSIRNTESIRGRGWAGIGLGSDGTLGRQERQSSSQARAGDDSRIQAPKRSKRHNSPASCPAEAEPDPQAGTYANSRWEDDPADAPDLEVPRAERNGEPSTDPEPTGGRFEPSSCTACGEQTHASSGTCMACSEDGADIEGGGYP